MKAAVFHETGDIWLDNVPDQMMLIGILNGAFLFILKEPFIVITRAKFNAFPDY